MHDLVILGAGKIGRMVCHLLARCGDYRVRVGDAAETAVRALAADHPEVRASEVDFQSAASLDAILRGAWGVVSCAPYRCNVQIAERARAAGAHYFDLTEDVAVTQAVQRLADGSRTVLAPQCGLAPGFVTIVATHLLQQLDEVRDLRLRVGALPRYPNNRLQYNLTWSTDGLVNEYCNPCEAIVDGAEVTVPPLEQLERLTIDGIEYEAFNTSGGLGTLSHSLRGKVQNLDYKTIRYPGHCELMKFLLHDLRFRQHKDELVAILDRAIPGTPSDLVVLHVSAVGTLAGRATQLTIARQITDQVLDGRHWTAIQVTTAAGVCGIVDLVREGALPQQGMLRMEQVPYEAFVQNRFGRLFGEDSKPSA